jgi:hypothetical protein
MEEFMFIGLNPTLVDSRTNSVIYPTKLENPAKGINIYHNADKKGYFL